MQYTLCIWEKCIGDMCIEKIWQINVRVREVKSSKVSKK